MTLAGHLRTFFRIRTSVLGVGLAFIGLMLNLSIDATMPFKQVCYIGPLFLVFALVRMIGSLTRSIYIFSLRLVEISSQFQAQNFWGIWNKYVFKRPEDSGSYAYVLIMRFLIWFVCIFAMGSWFLEFFASPLNIKNMCSCFREFFASPLTVNNAIIAIFFLFPLIFFLFSFWIGQNIETFIEPSTFLKKIEDEWNRKEHRKYPPQWPIFDQKPVKKKPDKKTSTNKKL